MFGNGRLSRIRSCYLSSLPPPLLICLCILLFLPSNVLYAQPSERLQTIDSLRQTVPVRAGDERPRLYKDRDGYVRFFGAPLGNAAELPEAVRSGTSAEAQALERRRPS